MVLVVERSVMSQPYIPDPKQGPVWGLGVHGWGPVKLKQLPISRGLLLVLTLSVLLIQGPSKPEDFEIPEGPRGSPWEVLFST